VRIDRLQQEYGVEVRWRVFPLHPEIPEEGMDLLELFPGREEMIRSMQERLLNLAAMEGLPLAERSRTCNSRRAQELGKWAEEQGQGDHFRMAVYRAYFVEGRNIALVDQLAEIAESVSLPGDKAREALVTKSHAPVVDADWRRAGKKGITAVPTHLCEGKILIGFSPYEDFLRLIEKG
jgi:predicted DsbA family dithiol-disulfide isomerase